MISKDLDNIELGDLQALVDDSVREDRTIEFKQHLPGAQDGERKEFLADVTSFANAIGGDLIYGIAERREEGRPTAVADSLDGIGDGNPDAERLRLENMLRDGVAPRLPNVRTKLIDGGRNGPLLVIRIPQSWDSPHMVTFKDWNRFYSRNDGGKQLLDVFEIRRSFLAAGELADRIRQFRVSRLGSIVARDTPVAIPATGAIVHLIPYSAFRSTQSVDVRRAAAAGDGMLSPLSPSSYNLRYNIDGLVTFDGDARESYSYFQLFRNGIIETVDGTALSPTGPAAQNGLASTAFTRDLFAFVGRAFALYPKLDVQPPVALLVTLIGAKDAVLPARDWYRRHGTFDRDVIQLPDVVVDDFSCDLRATLRPALDALWQAAGLERCTKYDENGQWIEG